jgi:hypothetical protein
VAKKLPAERYLTTTGTSCFTAHTSATTHPIPVHPRNKFSRKIASKSLLLRPNAISDGRKYITSPKLPKNGKKKNVERIIGTSVS